MTAVNKNNEESQASNEIEMSTANVNTGAPGGLTAGATTRSSLTFSWTAPTETGGAAIDHYNIKIVEVKTQRVITKTSTTTTYTMNGLGEDMRFKITVTAVNKNNEES